MALRVPSFNDEKTTRQAVISFEASNDFEDLTNATIVWLEPHRLGIVLKASSHKFSNKSSIHKKNVVRKDVGFCHIAKVNGLQYRSYKIRRINVFNVLQIGSKHFKCLYFNFAITAQI